MVGDGGGGSGAGRRRSEGYHDGPSRTPPGSLFLAPFGPERCSRCAENRDGLGGGLGRRGIQVIPRRPRFSRYHRHCWQRRREPRRDSVLARAHALVDSRLVMSCDIGSVTKTRRHSLSVCFAVLAGTVVQVHCLQPAPVVAASTILSCAICKYLQKTYKINVLSMRSQGLSASMLLGEAGRPGTIGSPLPHHIVSKSVYFAIIGDSTRGCCCGMYVLESPGGAREKLSLHTQLKYWLGFLKRADHRQPPVSCFSIPKNNLLVRPKMFFFRLQLHFFNPPCVLLFPRGAFVEKVMLQPRTSHPPYTLTLEAMALEGREMASTNG